MNDKLHRIKRFIESLPNDVETPEATLSLLQTASGITAGGTNDKNCINVNLETCKNSVNYDSCTNYEGLCNQSFNGRGCNNDCFLTTNKKYC